MNQCRRWHCLHTLLMLIEVNGRSFSRKNVFLKCFGARHLECTPRYVCHWTILLSDLNLLPSGCGLRGHCIERNKESMCDNPKNYQTLGSHHMFTFLTHYDKFCGDKVARLHGWLWASTDIYKTDLTQLHHAES